MGRRRVVVGERRQFRVCFTDQSGRVWEHLKDVPEGRGAREIEFLVWLACEVLHRPGMAALVSSIGRPEPEAAPKGDQRPEAEVIPRRAAPAGWNPRNVVLVPSTRAQA